MKMVLLKIWVRNMLEKKDIRTNILQKRLQMKKEEVIQKSERITTSFLKLEQYLAANLIYLYMDFRNEVMTNLIIEDARKNGKKIAIPKVVGNQMMFYALQDEKVLKEGFFGIREPERIHPITETDALMIVPGIAFEERGYRIGYGKGFYDQYLTKHKIQQTIALSYELQMVEQIPYDAYDIAMDWILTEERFICCQN